VPDLSKPILKAVILDFSAVNQVDVSSIQNLVDVRNQLDRYAAPATVSWHIANIRSPWTRRGLVAAGFGYPKYNSVESTWKPIISVADADDFAAHEKPRDVEDPERIDEKGGRTAESPSSSGRKTTVPLYGVNRPFFHVDVQSALESVNAIIEANEKNAPQ
jgi:sodium-independent sulfate anion transporter 11